MEQTYGVGDTIHHPTSFNCSMFDDNIVIIVIASTLEFSTGQVIVGICQTLRKEMSKCILGLRCSLSTAVYQTHLICQYLPIRSVKFLPFILHTCLAHRITACHNWFTWNYRKEERYHKNSKKKCNYKPGVEILFIPISQIWILTSMHEQVVRYR